MKFSVMLCSYCLHDKCIRTYTARKGGGVISPSMNLCFPIPLVVNQSRMTVLLKDDNKECSSRRTNAANFYVCPWELYVPEMSSF